MLSKNNHRLIDPPRWADKFLEWYCNPTLLEEIQGDSHELFYRTAKQNKRVAQLQFVWNVIRFFRWKNISNKKLGFNRLIISDMLRSYLLSAVRNLKYNSVSSTINIVGLSLSIGVAVTVFVLEDSFYSLDRMHSKGDRIAVVVNHVKAGDGTEEWARSPHLLANKIKQNSTVEMVARAGRRGANVRVGDLVFEERIMFADAEFMSMFDFVTLSGDRNCLVDKTKLIISEPIAIKYFGNTDVLGKTMSVKFDDINKVELTIGAIMEETPANSSMYINFLLPSQVWIDMNKDQLDDWSKHLAVCFVLFKDGAARSSLDGDFAEYIKLQNKANQVRPVQRVELIPLYNIATRSYNISGSLSWSNTPAGMIGLLVIGILLMVLACFNYMNVAVASVTSRLKEIGVRKVVGGGKGHIILQFLVENLVICSIAMIAGIFLAYYLFIPGFNNLFPIKIEFGVSTWQMAIIFFGGLIIISALLSGFYPALYVASFNAVKILKGKEKFGSKSLFSKTLLTVQFTLSIMLMVASLVFTWASIYFKNKDWGYNSEETLVIRMLHPRQYNDVKGGVESNGKVLSYAGAARHIGMSDQPAAIRVKENEYSARLFPVGFKYLETMNIRLKSGRFFDESIESDRLESAIVNETFVKKMGWTDPLNQEFFCDSIKRYVVGVVEDFYFNDFYSQLEPVVFTVARDSEFYFVVVKAGPGNLVSIQDDMNKLWKKVAPDDPAAIRFQSTVFERFMINNNSNNILMIFIASISIFLAAMGLYGLVAYNLTRRIKEYSIRKVFGANISQIFRLMSADYIWIVAIAFAIGAPLGALFIGNVLAQVYPFEIPVFYWPYVVSILLMIAMVGITVISQLRRVVVENPTETLRTE